MLLKTKLLAHKFLIILCFIFTVSIRLAVIFTPLTISIVLYRSNARLLNDISFENEDKLYEL